MRQSKTWKRVGNNSRPGKIICTASNTTFFPLSDALNTLVLCSMYGHDREKKNRPEVNDTSHWIRIEWDKNRIVWSETTRMRSGATCSGIFLADPDIFPTPVRTREPRVDRLTSILCRFFTRTARFWFQVIRNSNRTIRRTSHENLTQRRAIYGRKNYRIKHTTATAVRSKKSCCSNWIYSILQGK